MGATRESGAGAGPSDAVRRWVPVAWLLLALVFAFLLQTARTSVIEEIRLHALSVAAATAAGIAGEDLDAVQGPQDAAGAAFDRVQARLGRIVDTLPDIRYAYTMRVDPRPGAKPTDFVYIVDAPARDLDGDGAIGEDEQSEPPGAPYDASDYPAMIEALGRPAADDRVRPDPPYPDLISGYAPVVDATGRVAGIVGVDIAAATVRAKLAGIYAVNIGCGVLLMALVALIARLYERQQRALDENRALAAELAARNQELDASNRALAAKNDQMQAELRLAQQVQLGFLPREFPRRDRLLFDRFYITSEILGGDLFDVFAIDHDRVGLYMADVAGHGVSAALISGLLKMAVTTLKEDEKGEPATLPPGRVLARLNDLLGREIPDCEFITMVYAVLDLRANRVRLACAGHPPPFVLKRSTRSVEVWNLRNGVALGLMPEQEYPEQERALGPGEALLFYTDGLIEAMSTQGEEFGEERSLAVVRANIDQPAAVVLDALRAAVDRHRGGAAISDDFSLLVCSVS